MYDAIDDPYTYENSTVLVNKLDLCEQSELDDFEAEITSTRANEPLCTRGCPNAATAIYLVQSGLRPVLPSRDTIQEMTEADLNPELPYQESFQH